LHPTSVKFLQHDTEHRYDVSWGVT